jgi:lipopolysaccharide assembly outer membrane protein LptD (OstA)
MVLDDSIRLDSINRQKKNGIDAPVVYEATDSLVYDAQTRTAHLYGSSSVDYEAMNLKSDKIYMSLDSSLVHATGSPDSTQKGGIKGRPVFTMGQDKYDTDTMAFNFKTKKGLVQNAYTEQEDGYLTSKISRRNDKGEVYLAHGRYTTCDHEHPDFYISLSRAKVRPGKDVGVWPAYLVVADVPLPLAIPYGFFPFTKSYSSGSSCHLRRQITAVASTCATVALLFRPERQVGTSSSWERSIPKGRGVSRQPATTISATSTVARST